MAILVVAGLAGSYLATSRTPMYSSTSTVYVGQSASIANAFVQQGQDLLATSFSVLIPTASVADKAIQLTGAARTPLQVVNETKAAAIPSTDLIDVTVTDTSAAMARNLANGMAAAFVEVSAKFAPLVTQSGDVTTLPPATVAATAPLNTNPVSDHLTKNLLEGGLLGLAVAIALILLVDYMDLRPKGAEDLEKRVGLPVMGVLPARRAPRGVGAGT
ncbi:MAG: YveK family protein [Acidimicrobiales bacterium]